MRGRMQSGVAFKTGSVFRRRTTRKAQGRTLGRWTKWALRSIAWVNQVHRLKTLSAPAPGDGEKRGMLPADST